MTLQDDHIWNLAQRFVEESEIWTLGLKVLKLREHQVASIWNNNKPDGNLAARELLQKWSLQYESRTEAYRFLYDGLTNNGMNQRAALLKKWVKGEGLNERQLSIERFKLLQRWTRESLKNKPFCLALGKDWTLSRDLVDLREIHTDLNWTRKHRKAHGTEHRKMRDITQLLSEEQLGEEGPVRILVQAGGGMGKSTAMKYLAITWADGTSEELKKFDFVFHISLKQVKDNSSIESIIIAQHRGLKANEVTQEEVRSILKGSDNSKVLLLIDGHDEYKTGGNTDIDEAIKKEKLWNCWMILTSRETEDTNRLKEFMDAEVEICGFDPQGVETFIARNMGSDQQAENLGDLQMIYQSELGYSGLLRIPILLTMTCVLFKCKISFRKTRTGIIQAMVDRCMDRESLRAKGQKAGKGLKKVLCDLGKLAWQGLNEPGKKLIFERDEVIRAAGEEALELGLLFGTENLTPQEEETDVLCFLHLLLQEFAAAIFLSEHPISTLEMFFPTWEAIVQHEEVITFVCGLTSQPDELFDFTCRKAATQIAKGGIKRFKDKHFRPTDFVYSYAINRNLENDLCRLEKFVKEISLKQSDRKFIPRIRNNHLCLFDASENGRDLLLSKVYIFGKVSAILCQDPSYYNAHVNTAGTEDNDKLRFVIGIKEMAHLQPICSIFQKLRELKPIHITGVYSPDLYLEENNIHKGTNKTCLQGSLKLDTFRNQDKDVFEMIGEITKFQTVTITDLRILCRCAEDRRYFERTISLVSFDKGFKSLHISKNCMCYPDKDNMLSHSLISLLAQKLYVNCERASAEEMKQDKLQLNTTEESSLEWLSLDSFIRNEDLKKLVRPKLLTQLRKLELTTLNAEETFGEILGSGYPQLEMLCLLCSIVSESDIYILAETLANDGLPHLKCIDLRDTYVHYSTKVDESREDASSGNTRTRLEAKRSAQLSLERLLLSYSNIQTKEIGALLKAGQLNCLMKLELRDVTLTNTIADLLGSGFPALVCLDLSSAKLSRTDVNALATVRCPSLKWVNLSNNILTNCISKLLGVTGSAEQQTTFPCLEDLNLSRCNLSQFDLRALCTGLRNGRLSQLRRLDVHDHDKSANAEEVNTNIFDDLYESWKEHYKRYKLEIDEYDSCFNVKFPQEESPEKVKNVESKDLPGLVLFVSAPP